LYALFARTGLIRRLCELSRDEDLGARGPLAGDITSRVCLDSTRKVTTAMVVRSGGVVSGLAVLPDLIQAFGGGVEFIASTQDGQTVSPGATIATLSGMEQDVLTLERAALNVVGRLSGVATRTETFVREMSSNGGVRSHLYDTRKTTPGLRVLEKYAVRCGGGRCHRIGLYDAVLIKDNHLAGVALQDLTEFVAGAARRARAERPDLLFVEVEVDSLVQLEQVLKAEPGLIDVVLVDNMGPDDLRRAVELRDGSNSRPQLEASGGVRFETVRAIAETGVERISAGTLTHGAVWLDVALDIAP
jgi:nicotinate-nucleotide pyrophosphorylase (carboxylating)